LKYSNLFVFFVARGERGAPLEFFISLATNKISLLRPMTFFSAVAVRVNKCTPLRCAPLDRNEFARAAGCEAFCISREGEKYGFNQLENAAVFSFHGAQHILQRMLPVKIALMTLHYL
jgi:hypothetical protein